MSSQKKWQTPFLTRNIEKLLKECDIHEYEISVPEVEITTKCTILSHGNYPTKNLVKHQIEYLKNMAINQGYQVEDGYEDAGWVIGVENVELFKAAARGIRTTLVQTGVGHNLYKKMFAKGEIHKF